MIRYMRAGLIGTLLLVAESVRAAVPVGGFLPLVGIGLSDRFETIDDTVLFFTAQPSDGLIGDESLLGNGSPHYDLALLDTGANGSLLTSAAYAKFDLDGNGFDGTEIVTIGGATGQMDTVVTDPMTIYATGLADRTGVSPLQLNNSTLKGQVNTSLLTMPEESDLPNVLGLPFASQYASYIRNDQPQIFQLDGRTVRTPQIEFLPLGSGGQGITRRAPITLSPGISFAQDPLYVYNIQNALNGLPFHEDPTAHTHMNDGVASRAAMFLNASVQDDGQQLSNQQFFFDTGADVTVLSEFNAALLGFDVVLDEPEFTVAVVGSGGARLEVPGFFVDQLTIPAVGGSLTLQNVPIIVLNVTNPADPGNIVSGILGTNLLAGRNVVIDPDPSLGGGNLGPQLFIGDPVTTNHSWASTASSANWSTTTSWNAAGTPGELWIADVRHVSGGDQTAIVTADSTIWEVNVGGDSGSQMTVQVDDAVRLTTFSGVNVSAGGRLHLKGGIVDAQFIDIRDGSLTGAGLITTGSGPIPGQVENVSGTVAPGIEGIGSLEIEGRYSNGKNGTLLMEIGGLTPGTQHDQLVVDGGVSLAGMLEISLVNGFEPTVGNSFTLIDATEALAGTFDMVSLPTEYTWDVIYNSNSLVLEVLALGMQGDYNGDGFVNAADYVVWRNTMGDETSYYNWKNNFGSSSGAGVGASVPEPSAWVLTALLLGIYSLSRKRRSSLAA